MKKIVKNKKIQILQKHMKVNSYAVLKRAIEEGLEYGYGRAHKHGNNPPKDYIFECQIDAIMNSIDEVFKFDDE
jgi:hypothetical protein